MGPFTAQVTHARLRMKHMRVRCARDPDTAPIHASMHVHQGHARMHAVCQYACTGNASMHGAVPHGAARPLTIFWAHACSAERSLLHPVSTSAVDADL